MRALAAPLGRVYVHHVPPLLVHLLFCHPAQILAQVHSSLTRRLCDQIPAEPPLVQPSGRTRMDLITLVQVNEMNKSVQCLKQLDGRQNAFTSK